MMKTHPSCTSIRIGKHTIPITHPDKILFPDDDITKQEVCEYYHRIAPWMLPYIKNRPLTLYRLTHGIGDKGFYQKNRGEYFPDWIDHIAITKEHDTLNTSALTDYVIANNAATLVYLANQGCITFHPWLSTVTHQDMPDRVIIDLDPGKDSFELVRQAAYDVKELFETIGLTPYLMTTGSRGLHVVAPIKQDTHFTHVKEYLHQVIGLLVAYYPDRYTLEVRKNKRAGKLFLDILRNEHAQTAVAPYALRALPGAPVATPLAWHELADPTLTAQRFTLRTLSERLTNHEDPWRHMRTHALSLKRLIARIS